MDQPNYIVFLCYGYERVFHECAYALLSLDSRHSSTLRKTEIWIYTDNPGWFKAFKDCPLQLNYREVNAETIKKWRGAIDFVHRVKIEVLKDFTNGRTGNVLYADTDVVFTRNIVSLQTHIAQGRLCMHIMEGVVSGKGNPIFRKLNDHIVSAGLKLNGKPMQDMAMWNAGVLGFNTQHVHLLDEVLAFTDRVYPAFPKHVVEQFAFSAYFQDASEIKAASPYIFHYWNLKEAGLVLASFFEYFKGRSWSELLACSMLIQMETLMQEKVVFLSNRGMKGALTGKKWTPEQRDWGKLLSQI